MICTCRRHAECLDCLERAKIQRRADELRVRLSVRLHSVHVDRMPLLLPPWPPERRETA